MSEKTPEVERLFFFVSFPGEKELFRKTFLCVEGLKSSEKMLVWRNLIELIIQKIVSRMWEVENFRKTPGVVRLDILKSCSRLFHSGVFPCVKIKFCFGSQSLTHTFIEFIPEK